jgi:hypothetical protein
MVMAINEVTLACGIKCKMEVYKFEKSRKEQKKTAFS